MTRPFEEAKKIKAMKRKEALVYYNPGDKSMIGGTQSLTRPKSVPRAAKRHIAGIVPVSEVSEVKIFPDDRMFKTKEHTHVETQAEHKERKKLHSKGGRKVAKYLERLKNLKSKH